MVRLIATGAGGAVRKAAKAMDPERLKTPVQLEQERAMAESGAASVDQGMPTGAPWEMAGHALIPRAGENGRMGWDLPDIETEVDAEGKPNPHFIPKRKKNAAGTEEDNPHYLEARAMHDHMEALELLHKEINPNIDFQKEYADILAERQQNDERKPRGNALSSFAIALGGGRQAAAQYAETNKNADADDAEKAEKALLFKKSLVDAHVKQLVEEGNWQKAMKQNEISENFARRLKEAADLRAHQFKMDENEQLMGGREEVARINGQNRLNAARLRLESLGSAAGLEGKFLNAYMTEVGKLMAQLNAGIGKLNDPAEFSKASDDVNDMAVKFVETFRKQQAAEKATPAAKAEGDGAKGAGSMVQMMKNGQPHGAPITKEDFMARGGAEGAKSHGYTFKSVKTQ
jgi:hypothetical protein